MKSVVVESACTRASSSKAIVRPRGSRATAREHLSLDRLSLAEHVHLVSPYTFLRLFLYAGILAAVRGCASYLRPAPPPLQRPNYRIGEPATTMLSRRTFQGARRLERWHDGWWKVVYVWSTRACRVRYGLGWRLVVCRARLGRFFQVNSVLARIQASLSFLIRDWR